MVNLHRRPHNPSPGPLATGQAIIVIFNKQNRLAFASHSDCGIAKIDGLLIAIDKIWLLRLERAYWWSTLVPLRDALPYGNPENDGIPYTDEELFALHGITENHQNLIHAARVGQLPSFFERLVGHSPNPSDLIQWYLPTLYIYHP